MADEAETDLRKLSPDERAAWFRRQLVQLPGKIERTTDGKHWKVLDHQGSLPKLMVALAAGQLGKSVCGDLNSRLRTKDWRRSEPAEHDSRQAVHSILILPEDGMLPPEPAPDAAPAEEAGTETDGIDVDDLKRAATVMTWAAEQITWLRGQCDKLADENKDLRHQLAGARQELGAAASAAQARRKQIAGVAVVFRDGVNKLGDLQEK